MQSQSIEPKKLKCLVLIENRKYQNQALKICIDIFNNLEIKETILIIDPYSLKIEWNPFESLHLPKLSLLCDLDPFYWIKTLTSCIDLAIAIGEFKLSLDKTTPLSLLDQLCKCNNIPLFVVKLKPYLINEVN